MRKQHDNPNRPRPDLLEPDRVGQSRAPRLRMRQRLLLHPPGPDPFPGFAKAFGLVFLGRRPLEPGE